MHGVLVIDKPSGPTSHDVVARVRRALGEKRIGHTGTLDPLATGVLALVVGRATRLAQFLTGDEKEYLATVRLGLATPTYDAEGLGPDFRLKPDATGPREEPGGADFRLKPDAAVIECALAQFRGTCLQTPPPYSAKKVAGVRAYRHARNQQAVELTPVPVTVRALECVRYAGERLELHVACSSGFYVRTLAHDLGQRLGCGAHLEALRRTRSGQFRLDQALPLDRVESDPASGAARLVPMEDLLPGFPAAVLNEAGVRRVSHGNTVAAGHLARNLTNAGIPSKVRLFDPTGTLVALADLQPGGVLHPVVVLM